MTDPAENVSEVSDSEGTPEVTESSTSDRQGTISKIVDIFRGDKSESTPEESQDELQDVNDTPEESENEPEPAGDDGDDGDVIDPKFVETARKYGWNDEHIQSYASEHDETEIVSLVDMMSRTFKEEPKEDDFGPDDVEESDGLGDVLKQLDAVGDGDAADIVKVLAKELQTTRDELRELAEATHATAEERQQDTWRRRLATTDELFDKAAKDFTELGETKTLTKLPSGELDMTDPAVKTRSEIFDMAKRLNQTEMDWDASVKCALQWYRGGREDVVEQKVLRKIKKNSSRITPRRDSRHQTKTFDRDIDRKADVVNSVLRKYGTELPG